MRAPYRKRFDPSAEFKVRKPTGLGGTPLKAGDPFDKSLVSERRLRQMFDARSIVYADENPGAIMTAEQAANSPRGQHAARARASAERRRKAAGKPAKPRKAKEAEAAAKKGGKGKKAADAPKTPTPRKSSTEPRNMRAALKAKEAEAAARAEKRAIAKAEQKAQLDAARAIQAEHKRIEAEYEAARLKAIAEGTEAPPIPEHMVTKTPEEIAAERATVAIPDEWATLPWPQRLQLAAQFSDTPVKNGGDAEAAISAELARRGAS